VALLLLKQLLFKAAGLSYEQAQATLSECCGCSCCCCCCTRVRVLCISKCGI